MRLRLLSRFLELVFGFGDFVRNVCMFFGFIFVYIFFLRGSVCVYFLFDLYFRENVIW